MALPPRFMKNAPGKGMPPSKGVPPKGSPKAGGKGKKAPPFAKMAASLAAKKAAKGK